MTLSGLTYLRQKLVTLEKEKFYGASLPVGLVKDMFLC